MNNSSVRIPEESPFNEEVIQEREATLVRIITALEAVANSPEWSTLKTEIFDGLAESTKRVLLVEARGLNPDQNRLGRISGQLEWAERYANLSKLAAEYRAQLLMLKKNNGRQSQG